MAKQIKLTINVLVENTKEVFIHTASAQPGCLKKVVADLLGMIGKDLDKYGYGYSELTAVPSGDNEWLIRAMDPYDELLACGVITGGL